MAHSDHNENSGMPRDDLTLRAISYGGGVQSTALLVLAAQRVIDFPLFVMANVGDDSEEPATLTYVREIAAPFAAQHGIELVLRNRIKRDGSTETLWGRLMKEGSRSLPIPVRMSNGAPGTRSCTADFKIAVTARELKQRGAHGGRSCPAHAIEAPCLAHSRPAGKCRLHPHQQCGSCLPARPAVLGIGISVDEIQRANNRRQEPHEQIVYPLLDLRMRRTDCARLIADAGLPVPPKSSCWFCPMHRPSAWQDQAREQPDLFERACQLEDTLNERRRGLGRDEVFLTRFGIPLREAINTNQLPLFTTGDEHDGQCDSGWCFT